MIFLTMLKIITPVWSILKALFSFTKGERPKSFINFLFKNEQMPGRWAPKQKKNKLSLDRPSICSFFIVFSFEHYSIVNLIQNSKKLLKKENVTLQEKNDGFLQSCVHTGGNSSSKYLKNVFFWALQRCKFKYLIFCVF